MDNSGRRAAAAAAAATATGSQGNELWVGAGAVMVTSGALCTAATWPVAARVPLAIVAVAAWGWYLRTLARLWYRRDGIEEQAFVEATMITLTAIVVGAVVYGVCEQLFGAPRATAALLPSIAVTVFAVTYYRRFTALHA